MGKHEYSILNKLVNEYRFRWKKKNLWGSEGDEAKKMRLKVEVTDIFDDVEQSIETAKRVKEHQKVKMIRTDLDLNEVAEFWINNLHAKFRSEAREVVDSFLKS